ncbi:MAG TPA: response regulator transcription factor [Bacteroidota bacterium]|jgi:two-component system response regulator NreC|nr:response regulator transcription factor [Bacteroidota bacterium]
MEINSNSAIRVFIVDDHPMMQIGIKEVLSTHNRIQVVGFASDGEEVISRIRTLNPDIVLMDIRIPGAINGLEATAILQKQLPEVKVIILTMHDDEEYIRQFVKSGARGYVLKKSPPDELIRAIESVYGGQAYFSPAVSYALLKDQRRKNVDDAPQDLTEKEVEVLILIARGLTSKEIADKMCISARTVGKHRETLMQKLNMHSVADLTRYAIAKKLILTDKS